MDLIMHTNLEVLFILQHCYKFEGSVNDSSWAMTKSMLKIQKINF